MLQKIIIGLAFLISINLKGQKIKLDTSNLQASNLVIMTQTKLNGKNVLKLSIDTTNPGVDLPSYAKIKDLNIKNGSVEVKVLSKLMKNAPLSARGFIGLAFRINEQNDIFESIYIRPTNGRSDDQIRRNHSIQYFSYPDYKFDRLRKESPEKYESYADMGLNEWIKLKIEFIGNKASLYINDAKHPALLVHDLKHGNNISGSIGLWIGNFTEGYFSDLKVVKY